MLCTGELSCFGSCIVSYHVNVTIECSGDRACVHADIDVMNAANLYGHLAAQYSTFTSRSSVLGKHNSAAAPSWKILVVDLIFMVQIVDINKCDNFYAVMGLNRVHD